MPNFATVQSVESALKSAREAKLAAGGKFGVNDILHELLKIAQQGIDTPEERKGVSDVVMSEYDDYVNARVPEMFRDRTRQFVLDSLNAALLGVANL